jgi:thiol-disulfide isomerase/thioredoxin
MKMKYLVVFCASALLWLPAASAQNSATNALNALVKQVSTKIKDGKNTEAELAPELAQFDALLAEQQGAKTDDAAKILYMKAMLYFQVLENAEKTKELFARLRDEYATTKYGTNAAKQLEKLDEQLEARKLQSELKKKRDELLAKGKPFPDFAEKDLGGNSLSVGGLKGKVVLVDFWATWCGPCVAELPNVKESYKKYHADGFEIIGISLDGSRARLDSFLKGNPDVSWPQYFEASGDGAIQNWKNKLAEKYLVNSIPFTVLIGPDGKIIGTGLRGQLLAPAVAKALGK